MSREGTEGGNTETRGCEAKAGGGGSIKSREAQADRYDDGNEWLSPGLCARRASPSHPRLAYVDGRPRNWTGGRASRETNKRRRRVPAPGCAHDARRSAAVSGRIVQADWRCAAEGDRRTSWGAAAAKVHGSRTSPPRNVKIRICRRLACRRVL
ncbi:hypothetical protein BDY21DRAFT_147359 [Lineolata rhizophorae]|uniref:Uncharacterized protein n=1 Tax=Lineolata rhizophorae TaxID=578093 RepID=A0A6A6NNI0_9PEZI|nr:hypothetical protein BDY21DRAFT_147359 [Lineolata rhizophorae]